ncbi:MAG: hypothetical protein JW862_17315 [Anaerolineales bacterium]|nr:hypothetical protein [Anaerolineales bacterium]
MNGTVEIEGTLEQLYLSPASKFANPISRVSGYFIHRRAEDVACTKGSLVE